MENITRTRSRQTGACYAGIPLQLLSNLNELRFNVILGSFVQQAADRTYCLCLTQILNYPFVTMLEPCTIHTKSLDKLLKVEWIDRQGAQDLSPFDKAVTAKKTCQNIECTSLILK